jgi:hypothetical protein
MEEGLKQEISWGLPPGLTCKEALFLKASVGSTFNQGSSAGVF